MKLGFKGIDALGELLQALLIPFAPPAGREGAHQSHNRSHEEEPDKTHRDGYGKRFPKHHNYGSAGIAAYPNIETETKQ